MRALLSVHLWVGFLLTAFQTVAICPFARTEFTFACFCMKYAITCESLALVSSDCSVHSFDYFLLKLVSSAWTRLWNRPLRINQELRSVGRPKLKRYLHVCQPKACKGSNWTVSNYVCAP
jgi:hypothetical protein